MNNRKIRVLVAKCGLDGHERGARIIAHALVNAGMEVILLPHSPLSNPPEAIVATAIQEDVDVIGLSIHSPVYMEYSGLIIEQLKEKGMSEVMVIVGGIIPDVDIPKLKQIGVKEVFGAGSPLDAIVNFIENSVTTEIPD